MEKYSFLGVEKKPIIREIFQQRFPIMFIDEAQDTKSEIAYFCNTFPSCPCLNKKIVCLGLALKKHFPSPTITLLSKATPLEEQLCKTGEFAKKVDWICKGILKLTKMSPKKEIKYSNSAFRTIVGNMPSHSVREKLLFICNMDYSSQKEWNNTLEYIYEVFCDFIDKDKIKKEKFVDSSMARHIKPFALVIATY